MRQDRPIKARREFLKLLAASPLAAMRLQSQEPTLIGAPKEALNVLEFEAVAKKNLPPAHFGYMATGVDDDAGSAGQSRGFKKYQLRPRRMVDVSHSDLSVEVLGTKWDTPLLICPVAARRRFIRKANWQRQVRRNRERRCKCFDHDH